MVLMSAFVYFFDCNIEAFITCLICEPQFLAIMVMDICNHILVGAVINEDVGRLGLFFITETRD